MQINSGDKLIIGFAGEMGCGKGTAVDYIVKRYNGESLRFSTIIRDLLHRLYLPETRDNLQKISTVLRENFGQDILSVAMAGDIEKSSKKIVVLDGIRRLSDIDFLKGHPSFIFIYIETSINNRYNRIVQRSENPDDNIKTLDQFKNELENEAEAQIRELKRVANHIINNDGTLDDLYTQIDVIIKPVLI
ncbi:MAG: AAA family ATPase [Patescibacteria group bacterium]